MYHVHNIISYIKELYERLVHFNEYLFPCGNGWTDLNCARNNTYISSDILSDV
jgi:hypothetical protein